MGRWGPGGEPDSRAPMSAPLGWRGVLASISSSRASAAIWTKSASVMPKSAIAAVSPTCLRSAATASMAAAALRPASAWVSPAPRAKATSAIRSVRTGRLKRSTSGSSMASATPYGMFHRPPSEWPMAWHRPRPVLAIATPAMCAASSSCDRAARSSPSAQARGRLAAIIRIACSAIPSDHGLGRTDR